MIVSNLYKHEYFYDIVQVIPVTIDMIEWFVVSYICREFILLKLYSVYEIFYTLYPSR